jgi:hypothetical protein
MRESYRAPKKKGGDPQIAAPSFTGNFCNGWDQFV